MLVHWIWLSLRKGLNDREKCALLAEFPDPEDLFYAEESRILSLTAGKETAREALLDKNLTEAEEILAQCGEKKISILCYADRAYPDRLRSIADPPLVLYYQGSLPDLNARPVIGVVGTRKASLYGLNTARRLGRAQPTVANKLRLLRLPEDVRALLRENGLTERHARALLRLQDPEVQRRAAGDMVRRGMNVAQAEAYVEKLLQSAQVTPPRGRSTYIIKDVRLFLNSVDRGLHLMRQAGVDAGWNRQDTDREILLTIRIPKRASGKIDSVSESC